MPPRMKYVEVLLAQDHDTGITCVAFSYRGTFLASAGLDGRVCIWEVDSQRLLHVYKSESSISSISWMQNGEDSIIVGYEDGNVGTLSMTSNVFTLNGFYAHDHSVDSLANQGHMIATGAQCEVRVWEWHPFEPWRLIVALADPQKTAENLSREVLVVGVHWVMFGESPSVLAVAYQNHGILFYEPTSWTLAHALDNVRDPIARTSFSPDGLLVAISLTTGIEVRTVLDGAVCCAFTYDAAPEKYLVPVLFIQGGQAVASGSTTGAVHIWSREWSHKLQTLQHQNKDRVLALAAHHDDATGRSLLATGTYGSRAQPAVRLWATLPEPAQEQVISGDLNAVKIRSVSTKDWWRTALIYVLSSAVVALTVLAFVPDLAPL